jgi:putative endonuclease
MSQATKKIGEEGEDIAVELLISKGYEIKERNYRYGKGEIDIIAFDPEKNYIVFVEVKSRQNLEFGSPEYAITKNKIRQVRRIAEAYLYENEINNCDCRFDVVAVLFRAKIRPIVNHYENAFM